MEEAPTVLEDDEKSEDEDLPIEATVKDELKGEYEGCAKHFKLKGSINKMKVQISLQVTQRKGNQHMHILKRSLKINKICGER